MPARCRFVIALILISSLGLTACVSPQVSSDHQLLRVRVVRIWTDQEMIDDWVNHLRSLAGAPPLESYLGEYRRETVFLGYAGRGDRYDYSLAAATMRLEPGDVVELDFGTKDHLARAFEDIPKVRRVVCSAADVACINDARRGASLGRVQN
jgi:hypothetical protein